MSSYLADTFLGAPADDPSVQIGSAGNLSPMTPDGPPKPEQQLIRLPGGIVLPKRTAMILLAVIVIVALYLLLRKKNTSVEG